MRQRALVRLRLALLQACLPLGFAATLLPACGEVGGTKSSGGSGAADAAANSGSNTPCSGSPTSQATALALTSVVTYNGTIKELLQANCVSCHGGGVFSGPNLSTPDGVAQSQEQIASDVAAGKMPRNATMDAADKAAFAAWAAGGYLVDDPSAVPASAPASGTGAAQPFPGMPTPSIVAPAQTVTAPATTPVTTPSPAIAPPTPSPSTCTGTTAAPAVPAVVSVAAPIPPSSIASAVASVPPPVAPMSSAAIATVTAPGGGSTTSGLTTPSNGSGPFGISLGTSGLGSSGLGSIGLGSSGLGSSGLGINLGSQSGLTSLFSGLSQFPPGFSLGSSGTQTTKH